MKCARLEQELRKSKRREEKLTALQYRLKEDVRLMGSDARSSAVPARSWHSHLLASVVTGRRLLLLNYLSVQANSRMANTCCVVAHRRLCLPACLPFLKGVCEQEHRCS